ncbi:hypothetical protein TNCV_2311311 [Trichonephila clavipes]|nr:hypothetical protein TNCV_2311311 [Trichonephila clavipes]
MSSGMKRGKKYIYKTSFMFTIRTMHLNMTLEIQQRVVVTETVRSCGRHSTADIRIVELVQANPASWQCHLKRRRSVP